MAMTLDDFMQQLYGVVPPVGPVLPEGPVLPQSPYLPPQQSTAMGLPYPTSLMGEMPGSAPLAEEEPVTTAPAQYGYQPAPRGPLPGPIAEGPPALYGGFQNIYNQMQEEDPLAALMNPTPTPQGRPPLMAPGTPGYGGYGGAPDARQLGQQAMLARRFPRAMSRVPQLQALAARRGY